ncbi:amino acid adenylation domain-containing protein [Streptomyces sp. bgisy034]|uniref:amino acid adenylation domain-containing protein n=1 Tax=Streptomyces sp. bgisy034 TaxID=3413774 RepID=UPI003EBC46A2
MVAEQATRTPDRIAVSYRERTLTYRQLDEGSNALARRLRSVGVGGGSVVAVVLERSPDLIVALTAILKAGGAYLYLDPAEPAHQRERILRDAAARFAVAAPETTALVPSIEHVLCMSDDEPAPVTPLAAAAPLGPDTPMYVCYTSGSTGEPKGVVVPHRAVFRLINDPWWIDIRDDDVFLQMTRVGFDVSTFEIWSPLVKGCRLALAAPGHADLMEIVKTIQAEGVSILWLTTGLFHKMVDHHLDGLGGVRHLLAGGDVLSPAHVQRLLAAHPHLLFTNGYGPTENTTFTTCWNSRTMGSEPRVPIGRPIDGTTAMVLDDGMQPVAPGEVGELWVGGEGLATGYLNKPVATAEKFVASLDSAQPGSRMYRTGDLVTQSADGTLDFLGRADRQLKIRGYRVEPSTVEMELLRQPGVRQAAALAHTDGAGDARLVAYVAVGDMGSDESAAFSAALRERLHETLPVHLVPWAIFPVPDIPLNANGKVDRSSLPAVKMARNVWNDYVPPGDAIERTLAAIWSDTLEVEPIGVTDDFFDLGGHSLMAAELIAALQKQFDVSLTARTLFLHPTIEDLAQELRQQLALNTTQDSREDLANAHQ